MGDWCSFPSNGDEGQGYLALPGSGSGRASSCSRSGGASTTRSKRCATASQPRASSRSRPTSTTVSRRAQRADEAGKLMMTLHIEQAAQATWPARSTTSPPRRGHVEGSRRRRLLHGRHARAVARHAASPTRSLRWRRTTGSPDGRCEPDCSRLHGADSGPLRGGRRLLRAAAVARARGGAHQAGQADEFYVYPGTGHAFTNHHRPEVYDDEHTETGMAAHLAFLAEP